MNYVIRETQPKLKSQLSYCCYWKGAIITNQSNYCHPPTHPFTTSIYIPFIPPPKIQLQYKTNVEM